MVDDLPLARRDLIAARLALGQPMVVTALTAEFGVSEDAIRRDLRALAAEGRCRRVYGGALPIAPTATPIAMRIGEGLARKAALARTAAATIRPGELVFLDAGSTNLALVDVLPRDLDLTIATNSIDVAAAVLHRGDLRLLTIGGEVDAAVGGAIDAEAVLTVARTAWDRVFLGACALSPDGTLSAFVAQDATFKRTLLAAGRHCVVPMTTDKLTAAAPHRLTRAHLVDLIVVEHDAPGDAVDALIRTGATIRHADPPN